MSEELNKEIERRRTFAIISHPDAGKTTLTEKLLLFGGAIHVAGAVKSNKIKKTATSDWMEIEKQRGISVATSVMGFNYGDYSDLRRLGHNCGRCGKGRGDPDTKTDGGMPHEKNPCHHFRKQA